MTTYKISFNDSGDNEVYSVTKQFNSLGEASKYASLVLANTSDECVTFSIYEF